jgi:hypothetical protein
MNTTGIDPIKDIDFTADSKIEGRNLVVVLTGNADLNVKNELDRFLVDVHRVAGSLGAEEVSVDVRRLEFMNSSCLKCLVSWISQIQEQPPEKHYRIAFLATPAMYWQRRSLHALSCLAPELVSVQG